MELREADAFPLHLFHTDLYADTTDSKQSLVLVLISSSIHNNIVHNKYGVDNKMSSLLV